MAEEEDGVVVFGAGVAGVRVAQRLRALGWQRPIALVSDEECLPYDRPPLSKEIISGSMKPDDATILTADEMTAADLDVRFGRTCRSLRPDRRVATLDDGSMINYAVAVIATGARARTLPQVPDLGGVHSIRSLADAVAFKLELASMQHLVVIGAGFIGLEVASVAIQAGVKVTVVEAGPFPLGRVVPPEVGMAIAEMHIARGVDLRTSTTVEKLIGVDHVTATVLGDGTELPAEAVVVGIGAVPNIEWLEGSGVLVDDGVVCDSRGHTSVADVYGVGDASRWTNSLTGHALRTQQWQAAVEQAEIVAHNITHPAEQRHWNAVPYFWSTQSTAKIQVCGLVGPVVESILGGRGWLFGDHARLTGVMAINHPRVVGIGRKLVARGASWDDARAWTSSLSG